jgi:hypothetical protein
MAHNRMQNVSCCNAQDISCVPKCDNLTRIQKVRCPGTENVAPNVDIVLVDVDPDDDPVDLVLPRGRLGQTILIAVSDGTVNIIPTNAKARCNPCVKRCDCDCDCDCDEDGTCPNVTLTRCEQAIATFGLDCLWIVGKLVKGAPPPLTPLATG